MFSLNKLADRNFVIGFLLPVLIFAVAAATLFRDIKAVSYIYVSILEEKSFTSLTIVVLAIWSFATLLMVWNHAIYQALEGYRWPLNRRSWSAKWHAKFVADRFELRNMPRDAQYISKLEEFRTIYPYRPDLILPTRFGNVIRSFETYSLNVYGADAIPVWPRLAGVVPKDFADQLADARAEVDFWVNLWALALIFALLAMSRFSWDACTYLEPTGFRLFSFHELTNFRLEGAIVAGFAVVISWFSYSFAVERAQAWGDLVKSAFDLYLPALATALGYDLPATQDQRRAFWDALNKMFLTQDPLRPECWPRAGTTLASPTAAKSAEDTAEAEAIAD